MKKTANAIYPLATNNITAISRYWQREMQKITKILQNRLLKLQKFKNALILS